MRKDRIYSWIFMIIMIVAIYILFGVFKSHYFNGFIKAETNVGTSEFMRDKKVKYSDDYSYRITSPTQNDAAFYKEIEVEPHTPYRITCMVKTEDVVPSAVNTDGGACISIVEAAEISKSIIGTNDWQEIELMFNSKNRTKIKLGFRLGGNSGKAKGTAWFSDFKLERGLNSSDTDWKVGCFIFENTDVIIDGERMNFSMSLTEVESVINDIKRFGATCKNISEGKISISYELYNIEEPLTTISYSDEHEYYFNAYDVNKMIEDTVLENNFDYIFTIMKMGDNEKEIPVNNWVGLRKHGIIWNRFFKY